jgi:hypothetical protein
VSCSERRRELKRRRHRQARISRLKRRVGKASPSEKAAIATKLRKMTPGAEVVIGSLGLEER